MNRCASIVSYHLPHLLTNATPYNNDQFVPYSSTPLLLILQPSTVFAHASTTSEGLQTSLPFKAFEPTIEIRDRKSRSVFIEASFKIETGEAERIAVDWTARGGSGDNSCELWHLYLLSN